MNLVPESNLLIFFAVYTNAAWRRAYRRVKERVGIYGGIFCFFLVEFKYIKIMFIEKVLPRMNQEKPTLILETEKTAK